MVSAWCGADVKGRDRRRAAGATEVSCLREADEGGAVELGREPHRAKDAGDGERPFRDVHEHRLHLEVDAELQSGVVAEHDGRIAIDGIVEEAPSVDGAADGGEKVRLCGQHAQAAGFDDVDLVAAPDGGGAAVDRDDSHG